MTRTLTAFVRQRRSCASRSDRSSRSRAVPEIAFDTNRPAEDAERSPFVGEVGGVGANSKGQIFVYTRTGHPYATLGDNRTFSRGGSRLFQFDPTGKFVRELGQDVYGFNAAIGLRVDPQDNVWTIDEAANQVVKFDSDGRVALVLGRKPETIGVRPGRLPPVAAGGAGQAAHPVRSPAQVPRLAAGGAPVVAAAVARPRRRARIGHSRLGLQPSDRRGVGQGRQHLRRRRHRHQQPHRQVRQGRPVHHALGLDRHRAGPVQRREGARDRRAGQRLRRRRGQQAHPGVRRRRHVQVASSATSARRWRCA